MTPTDEELCLLAQSGDSSARDRLVARYLDLVGFRARGYLPDLFTVGMESEDLGQEGYSYSEIAEKLGCTAKSVENALGRIRRKLTNS